MNDIKQETWDDIIKVINGTIKKVDKIGKQDKVWYSGDGLFGNICQVKVMLERAKTMASEFREGQ